MITELATILRQIADELYEIFVLPGEYLVSQFAAQAPLIAAELGIVGNEWSVLLPVVLSLLLWILLVFGVWRFLRFCRAVARAINAAIRSVFFRIAQSARSLKTRLVCGLRRLLPRQRSIDPDPAPVLEFNDLDLAVLRVAIALGPGFAISAPELAEQLTKRPAQVQRSLDKLSSTKMLDYVIGSTEGFDNYRLTRAGSAFMEMLQRQTRRA